MLTLTPMTYTGTRRVDAFSVRRVSNGDAPLFVGVFISFFAALGKPLPGHVLFVYVSPNIYCDRKFPRFVLESAHCRSLSSSCVVSLGAFDSHTQIR